MKGYVQQLRIDGFGEILEAQNQDSWMIAGTGGREISLISFTSDVEVGDLDLEWQLIHPETNDQPERILLAGRLDTLGAMTPEIYPVNSGTMGYHEPLSLKFLRNGSGGFSSKAQSLGTLVVGIQYEQEDD